MLNFKLISGKTVKLIADIFSGNDDVKDKVTKIELNKDIVFEKLIAKNLKLLDKIFQSGKLEFSDVTKINKTVLKLLDQKQINNILDLTKQLEIYINQYYPKNDGLSSNLERLKSNWLTVFIKQQQNLESEVIAESFKKLEKKANEKKVLFQGFSVLHNLIYYKFHHIKKARKELSLEFLSNVNIPYPQEWQGLTLFKSLMNKELTEDYLNTIEEDVFFEKDSCGWTILFALYAFRAESVEYLDESATDYVITILDALYSKIGEDKFIDLLFMKDKFNETILMKLLRGNGIQRGNEIKSSVMLDDFSKQMFNSLLENLADAWLSVNKDKQDYVRNQLSECNSSGQALYHFLTLQKPSLYRDVFKDYDVIRKSVSIFNFANSSDMVRDYWNLFDPRDNTGMDFYQKTGELLFNTEKQVFSDYQKNNLHFLFSNYFTMSQEMSYRDLTTKEQGTRFKPLVLAFLDYFTKEYSASELVDILSFKSKQDVLSINDYILLIYFSINFDKHDYCCTKDFKTLFLSFFKIIPDLCKLSFKQDSNAFESIMRKISKSDAFSGHPADFQNFIKQVKDRIQQLNVSLDCDDFKYKKFLRKKRRRSEPDLLTAVRLGNVDSPRHRVGSPRKKKTKTVHNQRSPKNANSGLKVTNKRKKDSVKSIETNHKKSLSKRSRKKMVVENEYNLFDSSHLNVRVTNKVNKQVSSSFEVEVLDNQINDESGLSSSAVEVVEIRTNDESGSSFSEVHNVDNHSNDESVSTSSEVRIVAENSGNESIKISESLQRISKLLEEIDTLKHAFQGKQNAVKSEYETLKNLLSKSKK
ncbi:hypothetical protein DID75_03190 [Candidatus Marinamargulisbacteria bacterium SCGC AG-410-N11]|nr:hypothetical protein DID75_03190 [Candidatus Marinamargulisbacteria bacterium SCGC AG-410-N11]